MLERARAGDARLAARLGGGALQPGQHLAESPGRRDRELEEAEALCTALSGRAVGRADRCRRLRRPGGAELERTDDALDSRAPGLRLAQMTGQSPFIPGLLVLETNALFMKGRITEALAVAENATEAAVLTGNDQFAVWALWADAIVSLGGGGDRAGAGQRPRGGRPLRAGVGETFFSSLSRLHLAAALSAAGDRGGDPRRAGRLRSRTGPAPARPARRARLGAADSHPAVARRRGGRGRPAPARPRRARAPASLPQRIATAVCARAAVLLARRRRRGRLVARPGGAGAGAVRRVTRCSTARARALFGAGFGRVGDLPGGDRRARARPSAPCSRAARCARPTAPPRSCAVSAAGARAGRAARRPGRRPTR